eukprot:scaffold4337_cov182-Ochromonas_danica.AAC.7
MDSIRRDEKILFHRVGEINDDEEMSKSMIYNDDYCDLPDGSDEPGTSACSYLKVFFHCLDKHCQPVLIPTSRVNDGVCDCGDGSDEWDTRYSSRTCTNHCLRPPPAHPSPRTNNTTVFLRRGTNLVTSTSAITSTISLTSHSSSQGLGVSLESDPVRVRGALYLNSVTSRQLDALSLLCLPIQGEDLGQLKHCTTRLLNQPANNHSANNY